VLVEAVHAHVGHVDNVGPALERQVRRDAGDGRPHHPVPAG
jgi:hypothetical protein